MEGNATERRRPISVVLADDERLIRVALAQTLIAGGMELAGEAGTGGDLVELVLDLRPDVVLMELNLPDLDGVEVIRRITALAPASNVLVLTRAGHNQVVEAIMAGASGYIVKTAAPEEIVSAVRATSAGDVVISSQVAGGLLERIRGRATPLRHEVRDDAAAIRAVLTPRELEIFTRLASGQSNNDIGRELSLSGNTVANHLASILAKLQVDNRIQAAVRAVRSGIAR